MGWYIPRSIWLQKEYTEECLQWIPVNYSDNRPCIDILDGRASVFSLLNEVGCNFEGYFVSGEKHFHQSRHVWVQLSSLSYSSKSPPPPPPPPAKNKQKNPKEIVKTIVVLAAWGMYATSKKHVKMIGRQFFCPLFAKFTFIYQPRYRMQAQTGIVV